MKWNKIFYFLSFIVLLGGCNTKNKKNLSTKSFKVGLQNAGAISGLIDISSNKNHEFIDQENSLLAIQVNGQLEYPSAMNLVADEG